MSEDLYGGMRCKQMFKDHRCTRVMNHDGECAFQIRGVSADNRELFQKQMTEHMNRLMTQLDAALKRDKIMMLFDAIATESIRLKVPSWDQIPFVELREKVRAARAAEPALIGVDPAIPGEDKTVRMELKP